MRTGLTILAMMLLGFAAAADGVHLKDGRKIEGKVTDLGDRIRIERSFGSMTIDKAEVDRIEAREAYEKVLKLQPSNAEAKKRLEELRKAK
jgi:hypothetical protein